MFGKLREKLSGWTKKISDLAKGKAEEEAEKQAEEALIEKIETIQHEKVKEAKKKDKLKKERHEKIKNEGSESAKILENISEKFETKPIETIKEQFEEVEKIIPQLEQAQNEEKIEKQGFFKKIFTKVQKTKISKEEFEVYAEELEMLLLENNVAMEVAEKIIYELKKRIVNQEFLKKEIEGQINEVFKDIISDILIPPFDVVERIKLKKSVSEDPYIMLFCGINGTGKTTTIAKIADYLKSKKVSVILAAGDTFRAASIEQLKTHGDKLGIKVISKEYGSDPASVGFDAIQYAKGHKIDCVLIDTAGRMHTAQNLLREIEKISRVCKPDLKIYVGESITGNDAVEQVKSFNEAIGIDGIVLTKADIDEKGGTALSVGHVTRKPILFLGTGQEYGAIEPFNKNKFIEKLGL
jgi:fused signal recognition particle receptor